MISPRSKTPWWVRVYTPEGIVLYAAEYGLTLTAAQAVAISDFLKSMEDAPTMKPGD